MAPSFVTTKTNKSVAGEMTPPLVLQKHTRQFRHIMVNFKEMEVSFGVRFGSGTEIQAHQPGPLYPESRHYWARRECPLGANSGHQPSHSITSSARLISVDGKLMPSARAAFRFTRNSKRVGSSRGRSAGRAPRRIRATRSPARSPISLCLGPYDIRPPSRTTAPDSKIVGNRLTLANSTTYLRLSIVKASDTMSIAWGGSRCISANA